MQSVQAMDAQLDSRMIPDTCARSMYINQCDAPESRDIMIGQAVLCRMCIIVDGSGRVVILRQAAQRLQGHGMANRVP